MSWDTNVRPCAASTSRIGSSESRLVFSEETSCQVALPELSSVTASVSRPAWYMTVPPFAASVFQSTPIDGSPASSPSPVGAV